ncbi:glycosyl hydrolase [Paenibacillus anaericanus]|uniref:Glycosyl hydrolase n=1 Tax=Paenibacillus anaericanus TaxID=170367 RepID=A0A3S1BJW4_9BACL|nr:glycoside hydrolase family 99-like domain-containing protein [Paenibacillus anaericanus]RUT42875.1 glycosyl hydrolase [Paenibacillus anaericanus]
MNKTVKPVAFYLPQYHQVEENSLWWGKGFTEWTNVARAKPNFWEHYQPHVPKDLGFYDLSNVEVMREQAKMAELYGLYGFCFYFYWFNGRRILETPLNNYIQSNIDFPFCFCWANENWTRTWDGLDKEILLKQNHNPEDDLNLIRYLIPIFKDDRYIKVDGKPMFVVYRVDLFPDIKQTVKIWREEAKKAGFEDIHLCAVQFYGIDDPTQWGFDAAIEFPPHKFINPENKPVNMPQIANPNFSGGIVDYPKVVSQALQARSKDYIWYRGIVPSWDNTARRQDNPHLIINSSPNLYRFWLRYIVQYSEDAYLEENRFVFINAWNEWGEGCHLEPDLKNGNAYLEATAKALQKLDFDLNEFISYTALTNSEMKIFVEEYNKAISLSVLYAQENRNLNLKLHDKTSRAYFVKNSIKEKLKNYPKMYKLTRAIYLKVRGK